MSIPLLTEEERIARLSEGDRQAIRVDEERFGFYVLSTDESGTVRRIDPSRARFDGETFTVDGEEPLA